MNHQNIQFYILGVFVGICVGFMIAVSFIIIKKAVASVEMSASVRENPCNIAIKHAKEVCEKE